ncbi:MAG: hypothetical protein MUC36_11560 [Planctomycetes bacterium]|jgi:hypothetical protein|nr:hypothetical protein [Planctomycetota bacterium]
MTSIEPRSGARRSLLAGLLVLGACATPQDPLPPPRHRPPETRPASEDHGRYGQRFVVEANAIPGAWLTLDRDGGADAVDTGDGSGYGVRMAVGNLDQSIGLSWQGFATDGLDANVLGLDVDVRRPIGDGLDLFYVRAGAGIGAAWLDALDDPALGNTGTAQLRLGLDFQPNERFLLSASFGGIAFGRPGETEAYGTFFQLGLGLVF